MKLVVSIVVVLVLSWLGFVPVRAQDVQYILNTRTGKFDAVRSAKFIRESEKDPTYIKDSTEIKTFIRDNSQFEYILTPNTNTSIDIGNVFEDEIIIIDYFIIVEEKKQSSNIKIIIDQANLLIEHGSIIDTNDGNGIGCILNYSILNDTVFFSINNQNSEYGFIKIIQKKIKKNLTTIDAPIIVSYTDFCKNYIQNSAGLNNERNIIKITDTTFTCSDVTRLENDIPVVIRTDANKYIFNIVKSVNGNTITLLEPITENFLTIQDILAANGDGMHLSKNAYMAFGQNLALLKTRNHLLKYNILNGNIQNGKIIFGADPKVYKLIDNTLMLDFSYLPGSIYGTPVSNYCSILNENDYLMQSSILDYGVSLTTGIINRGGVIIISAYIQLNVDYYGEWKIELLNSSNEVIKTELVNHTNFYSNKYFNIPVTGIYTLKFKSNKIPPAGRFNIMKMSNIQIFNENCIISESIFKENSKIALLGDSWTQRIGETPYKIRPDGSSLNGQGTMGEGIKSIIQNSEVLYYGLAGSTSEWGRRWVDSLIYLRPTHIILNFGINDYNSRNNYPSTSSSYDFSATNKWLFQSLVSGGIMGSVSKTRYIENMSFLINKCLQNRIIPIVLIDPPISGFITNSRNWTSNIYNY